MKRCWSTARSAVPAVAAVLVLAGCGQSSGNSGAQKPTSAPSSPPSGVAEAHDPEAEAGSPVPRCSTANLSAHVVEFGSTGSAPFLIVSLTNEGTAPCHLRGYPAIAATGRLAHTHEEPCSLDIAVRRGSIYTRHDPGPRRVKLDSHGKAFFTLGTATGYNDPTYEITRLTITPPRNHGSLKLRVAMPANGPAKKPIPRRHRTSVHPAHRVTMVLPMAINRKQQVPIANHRTTTMRLCPGHP